MLGLAAYRNGSCQRLGRLDQPRHIELATPCAALPLMGRQSEDPIMPEDGLPELPPHAFAKIDSSPDTIFYAEPRFVTHIDHGAIGAVTGLYRALFSADGTVLDLMSSWVSHLPEEVAYAKVIGHGM